MRISVAEVSIWLFVWFTLSLIAGVYLAGHAWQMIPLLGAIYGLVAGVIYSIASSVYTVKRGRASVFIASLFGLFASTCTVPILVILTVHLNAALLFAVVAGPATGVVVNFIVQRKQGHEATS